MTKIYIVDAFTRTVGTGNRAGVVLDAEGLCEQKMQEIAAFAGYSETAFVFPSKGEDYDIHVRYFTPEFEVPICGHATIATHFLRAQFFGTEDYQVKAKTGAGILPVQVSGSEENRLVTMTQGLVEYGAVLNIEENNRLLRGLGIEQADLIDGLPVQIVSTGHSKVMVPLKSRRVLDAIKPDAELLSLLSRKIECNGFFPFTIDNKSKSLQTFGRMFAPAIGILEDPVTGNANGPAGAYLYKYGLVTVAPEITYAGHQGFTLRKPGTVFVTLKKKNDILTVEVAGNAVLAGELKYG